MAQEIITLDDLQNFRLQLLEDLKGLLQQPNHSQKHWLKSSEVRKMLGIPMAIGTHGTLQNLRIKNLIPYQKIGGLMFYKYDDIIKLLEGDKQSKSVGDG
jgi:hypothetical protein